MARGRRAPLGAGLSWSVLCFAVGCAQPESRAPYFNPMGGGGTQGTFDGDGGQMLPQDGGMAGGSGGISGGGGMAGTVVTGGDPGPDFGDLVGDPATFDPEQVYVQGSFVSNLSGTNPFGAPCTDPLTGIADWSSPNDDWSTDFGLTVALGCESDDVRIRTDGSIAYAYFGRDVWLMNADRTSADPGSAVVNVDLLDRARPHENDVPMVKCGINEFPMFRHFVHPENGSIVYVCFPDGGDAPFVHFTAVGDKDNGMDAPFPVPAGYIVTHLGYDDYVLVHDPDDPGDLGVLSGGTDIAPVASSSEFAFAEIQAVRATQDGFLLLIMRNPDPPELELWSLSYQAELSQVGVSASGAEIVLNEERCPNRGGDFSSGVIDKLPRAGCMCALEPDGTAVCLAREGAGDEIVVRFTFGEANEPPQTVYRVADDPYLQTFEGLITGP